MPTAPGLDAETRTYRVALVAVPESGGSSLFGIADVFSAVGREWETLAGKPIRGPFFQPLIASPRKKSFRTAKGMWLMPDASFAEVGAPDIICVTDLGVPPTETMRGRLPQVCKWLRECHEAGSVICSVCNGTLLLAAAGLLDGRACTTHWAYSDTIRRGYPEITIHPQRVLVSTGPGERIITSGGWASWSDLALYLIARFAGEEQAQRIARLFLLQLHTLGQQPYANLAISAQHEDSIVGTCQEWLALNYDEPNPVTTMVERSGLPERTIKRRFCKATGVSPLDYVHNLRIEEAKQMLETGAAPIEEIAAEVGYQEPGFFRRLFKRRVGLTPGAYRRAFGSAASSRVGLNGPRPMVGG
jgi:transcriptional regulator GlxA family with amidase domain